MGQELAVKPEAEDGTKSSHPGLLCCLDGVLQGSSVGLLLFDEAVTQVEIIKKFADDTKKTRESSRSRTGGPCSSRWTI